VDPAQDLQERWAGWQRAIEDRDVQAVAEYLADDYALVLVQPNRAVLTRAQWLALLPDYVVSEYEIQEQVLDVEGDLAVALHRARMAATVLGADRSGTFVVSDVWRRYDGVWKVWRRHSTPLAAGAMPQPPKIELSS
jgi:ketosteroid isomerase-like protein